MANPNPSPKTRFKPGESGNPGGKSKEQKQLETEAAMMALRIRHAMLSSMQEKLQGEGGDMADALDLLNGDARAIMKDAEDRAFGRPHQTQTVDAQVGVTINRRTVYEAKPDTD